MSLNQKFHRIWSRLVKGWAGFLTNFRKARMDFLVYVFFGSILRHLVFYSALRYTRRYRVPSSEQKISNSGGCSWRGRSGQDSDPTQESVRIAAKSRIFTSQISLIPILQRSKWSGFVGLEIHHGIRSLKRKSGLVSRDILDRINTPSLNNNIDSLQIAWVWSIGRF